jgi:hypothetical protein
MGLASQADLQRRRRRRTGTGAYDDEEEDEDEYDEARTTLRQLLASGQRPDLMVIDIDAGTATLGAASSGTAAAETLPPLPGARRLENALMPYRNCLEAAAAGGSSGGGVSGAAVGAAAGCLASSSAAGHQQPGHGSSRVPIAASEVEWAVRGVLDTLRDYIARALLGKVHHFTIADVRQPPPPHTPPRPAPPIEQMERAREGSR